MNPLQIPSDVLSGSRPSSRRVTVKLIRFTLGRCWPRTIPWKASWRTRRHWYIGQKQANSTCSVTSDGTTGNSMLSRVRRTHPPFQWGPVVGADVTGVPHPLGRGHLFTGKTMPPLPAAAWSSPHRHPQLPLLRLGKRKAAPRSARISRQRATGQWCGAPFQCICRGRRRPALSQKPDWVPLLPMCRCQDHPPTQNPGTHLPLLQKSVYLPHALHLPLAGPKTSKLSRSNNSTSRLSAFRIGFGLDVVS